MDEKDIDNLENYAFNDTITLQSHMLKSHFIYAHITTIYEMNLKILAHLENKDSAELRKIYDKKITESSLNLSVLFPSKKP